MSEQGGNEMNIREIVKKWLKLNYHDGLVNVECGCGCGVDDLFPCEYFNPDNCEPGFVSRVTEKDHENNRFGEYDVGDIVYVSELPGLDIKTGVESCKRAIKQSNVWRKAMSEIKSKEDIIQAYEEDLMKAIDGNGVKPSGGSPLFHSLLLGILCDIRDALDVLSKAV